MVLQNTIVAESSRGANCAGTSSSAITDAGHDLSFPDTSCPGINGDPKFLSFNNFGGPTKTLGLASGSAAIDQVPATGAGCPATDQRGVKRPQGSACDIGAFEFATPQITITAPAAGASYTLGSTVLAGYRCIEGRITSPIATCKGTAATGQPIDTSSAGTKTSPSPPPTRPATRPRRPSTTRSPPSGSPRNVVPERASPGGRPGKDAGTVAQQRCARFRGRRMAVIRGRHFGATFRGGPPRRPSALRSSDHLSGSSPDRASLIDRAIGCHTPRSAAAASPPEAVASSPRARALPQLVRTASQRDDVSGYCSPGEAGTNVLPWRRADAWARTNRHPLSCLRIRRGAQRFLEHGLVQMKLRRRGSLSLWVEGRWAPRARGRLS